MPIVLLKSSIGSFKIDTHHLKRQLIMLWSLGTVTLISLSIVFGLVYLNLRVQKTNHMIMESLSKENQRLTNLLMSKDPMTFSTLQTLTTDNSPVAQFPVAEPGDDIYVAHRFAAQYKAQCLEPARASDSPEDALQDFGGIQGLM